MKEGQSGASDWPSCCRSPMAPPEGGGLIARGFFADTNAGNNLENSPRQSKDSQKDREPKGSRARIDQEHDASDDKQNTDEANHPAGSHGDWGEGAQH